MFRVQPALLVKSEYHLREQVDCSNPAYQKIGDGFFEYPLREQVDVSDPAFREVEPHEAELEPSTNFRWWY
jgi:hypothetical protein